MQTSAFKGGCCDELPPHPFRGTGAGPGFLTWGSLSSREGEQWGNQRNPGLLLKEQQLEGDVLGPPWLSLL